MAKNIKALKAELSAATVKRGNYYKKVSSIEAELYRRAIEPKLKAIVGKCFKYRNSYGSSRPDWWLYCKIIGYETTNLIVCTCQTDCGGEVKIKPKDTCFVFRGEPRDYHLFQHSISRKQFDAAINRAIKRLEKMKG